MFGVQESKEDDLPSPSPSPGAGVSYASAAATGIDIYALNQQQKTPQLLSPAPLRRTISRNLGVPANASSFRNVQQRVGIQEWDKLVLGKLQTKLDTDTPLIVKMGENKSAVSFQYTKTGTVQVLKNNSGNKNCWFLYGGAAYRKLHDFLVTTEKEPLLYEVAPRSNDYDVAILTSLAQQSALVEDLRTFLNTDLLPSLVTALGNDYWTKPHELDGRTIQFTPFEGDNMFHIETVRMESLSQLRVKVQFTINKGGHDEHKVEESILDLSTYGRNPDGSIDSIRGVYGGKVPELLSLLAEPLLLPSEEELRVNEARRTAISKTTGRGIRLRNRTLDVGYDSSNDVVRCELMYYGATPADQYKVVIPPFSHLLELSMDGMEKRVRDYKCKQDYARMSALLRILSKPSPILDAFRGLKLNTSGSANNPGVREMARVVLLEDKFAAETADGAPLAVCRGTLPAHVVVRSAAAGAGGGAAAGTGGGAAAGASGGASAAAAAGSAARPPRRRSRRSLKKNRRSRKVRR